MCFCIPICSFGGHTLPQTLSLHMQNYIRRACNLVPLHTDHYNIWHQTSGSMWVQINKLLTMMLVRTANSPGPGSWQRLWHTQQGSDDAVEYQQCAAWEYRSCRHHVWVAPYSSHRTQQHSLDLQASTLLHKTCPCVQKLIKCCHYLAM